MSVLQRDSNLSEPLVQRWFIQGWEPLGSSQGTVEGITEHGRSHPS